MKISTRGRYGMRVLIDLAEHANESHVTLASIAEREGISLRYLEQVVVIMRRAGFIQSVKGASGGYRLARDPREIIVGDVLRALEGDMLVVDPPAPADRGNRLKRCLINTVYEPLNRLIAAIIDNQTLESLVGTKDSEELMYFI
ncbi:MAG: Rrf2 family transcriptional regulator [Spirochaetaceae bacterium]|jgi:Rrf2 family protein|nr:Rrf2 family transcriptional regulator [Spirochaetaceae bacterium]